MKSKTIIISFLLALLIIGVTVVRAYIPTVLYAVGVLVILICLVYYVFELLLNEKKYFEEKLQNINVNVDSAKTEILRNQTEYKKQIISDLADKYLSIQQLVSKGIDSINEETTKKIDTVKECLTAQSEDIDNKFKKEIEIVNSLLETTQSLSSEILSKIESDSVKIESVLNKTAEQIKNEEECTRRIIEDVSNNISALLNSLKEAIENTIETSTNSIAKISQENKDTLITSVTELSSQEISSRESLSFSLLDVLQKTRELKGLVETCQKSVTSDINNRVNEVTENIAKCIVDAIGVVADSINKTQVSLSESTDSLLQTYKLQGDNVNNNILSVIHRSDALKETVTSFVIQLREILDAAKLRTDEIIRNVESVKQQNNILQESIVNNNELITNNAETVVASTNQHKTEIVELVLQNEANISADIEQCVSNALTTLAESIDQTKTLSAKTEETLLQSNREQTQVVYKSIKDIEEHYSVLHDKLDEILKISIDEIKDCYVSESSKTCESITSNISSAVNKVEECVVKTAKSNNDNAELLSESLIEMTNTISNKIGTIESQNQILTTDIKYINDSRKDNVNALQAISDQFNSLQKALINVQIQSNNVENLVNEFTKKNSNSSVIDSIKSMMAELRKELKTDVSDINDEILETQIKQEIINDELDKLQVLLRNISKGSAQVANGTPELSTPSSITTSKIDRASNTAPQKQQEVKRTIPIVPSISSSTSTKAESKPNRTETIIDSETNNIVYNQFVSGKLAKSTMKDKNGHIVYELEYKDGKIGRSRNYDARGIMNIEQTYYDNGQVHFRNEMTINGRKSTEFDRNGNKK